MTFDGLISKLDKYQLCTMSKTIGIYGHCKKIDILH